MDTKPSLFARIARVLRPERHLVSGVISRIGPWHGPSDIAGIVLLLEGDPMPYHILRDDNMCQYPAGLSKPGDTVEMMATDTGSVGLSSFRNLNLNLNLNAIGVQIPCE